MCPIEDIETNDLHKIYDSLYASGTYDSGPVGDLFKWVKDHFRDGGVIDLCCGNGFFNNYIKTREYLGLDFAQSAVTRNIARWPGRQFEVADMTKPLQNVNKWPNIVMCDALEHFRAEDLTKVFDNIKSLHDVELRSKIFFSISTRPSSGWKYNGEVLDLHLTVWPAEKWLEYIESQGLTVTRYESRIHSSTLLVECEIL